MGDRVYTCIVHSLALLFGLIASGFCFAGRSSDVLDLLQFVNKTSSDFTYITGTTTSAKAIFLQATTRNLLLPETVATEALMLLRNSDDVTFLATVKQEAGTYGSIFAFSAGHIRYLELESNGQRDELLLHYIHDQHIHTETFPNIRLADNHWHNLALTLNDSHVTLYINCSKVLARHIEGRDRLRLNGSNLNLYIGQRNQQSALFMGAIQELKIVTKSNAYLDQCPNDITSCASCAEFHTTQSTINHMYSNFNNLTKKMLQDEEQLYGLQQCQCLKGCRNNTDPHASVMWQKDQCTICKCQNASIDCRQVACPALTCERQVNRSGECCPVCSAHCYFEGKRYQVGESMTQRKCVTCTCQENLLMRCVMQDPATTCPRLECPAEDVINIQDRCCPICRGTDFCSLGNDCHGNASCVNLATRYACQCTRGYHGDGINCQDVDECQEIGGHSGHHCHSDEVCVNTIGDYTCKCKSGTRAHDDQSCISSGQTALTITTSWWHTWTLSVILVWLCLFLQTVKR